MQYLPSFTRNRVYLDLEGQEKKVDDSFGNDTDVNKIVAKFARTGEMPETPPGVDPIYEDVTNLQGDLTELIAKGQTAQKALTELENVNQAKLKEEADNNAAKAEADAKRLAELEARYQSESGES